MLKMGGIKIIKIKWGLYIVNYSMLPIGGKKIKGYPDGWHERREI